MKMGRLALPGRASRQHPPPPLLRVSGGGTRTWRGGAAITRSVSREKMIGGGERSDSRRVV